MFAQVTVPDVAPSVVASVAAKYLVLGKGFGDLPKWAAGAVDARPTLRWDSD